MGSKKFSLDKGDFSAVIKNGLLVALAAFLTYVMNNLGAIDLGDKTPLVIPIVALIMDTVAKWAKNNAKDVDVKNIDSKTQ